VIITAGRLGEQLCWSKPRTRFSARTPHRGSHTAVAVGAAEELLGKLRVRACPAQAEKLVAWAQAWPKRTWAVEGAQGLGGLLAQQLVAAGERWPMCSPS
jgi:hypothetical protein